MTTLHEDLRDDVRMLGDCLGQTIVAHKGQAFLEKIEKIRTLSKAGRSSGKPVDDELLKTLGELGDDELLPVARAFTQFLNLSNIAEEHSLVVFVASIPSLVVLCRLALRKAAISAPDGALGASAAFCNVANARSRSVALPETETLTSTCPPMA